MIFDVIIPVVAAIVALIIPVVLRLTGMANDRNTIEELTWQLTPRQYPNIPRKFYLRDTTDLREVYNNDG